MLLLYPQCGIIKEKILLLILLLFIIVKNWVSYILKDSLLKHCLAIRASDPYSAIVYSCIIFEWLLYWSETKGSVVYAHISDFKSITIENYASLHGHSIQLNSIQSNSVQYFFIAILSTSKKMEFSFGRNSI
jgi:hypothetical protein